MKPEQLTQRLLDWYDRNRRQLPWRQDRDPYRVWVSEIMLQQTRVEAVIPYYNKFLQRFPSLHDLAAAPEEEVLSYWQGLGYYSRVRNLQQGVREVVARYGGQVPDSPQDVRKLPGVGDYTAGAILSIAHNKPEPAVDGNVLRVISRLQRIEEPVEQSRTRKRVEQMVRDMMEQTTRYGDFTQALMELGALVCTPRSPRCGSCPWQDDCIAARDQVQAELPKKKAAEPPRQVQVHTGILIANQRVLAVQRPKTGLLAGMWQFPAVEVILPEQQLSEAELALALQQRFQQLGQTVLLRCEWQRLNHVFSHRQWDLRAFLCDAAAADFTHRPDASWLTGAELKTLNWAGPYRKLADRVQTELLDS